MFVSIFLISVWADGVTVGGSKVVSAPLEDPVCHATQCVFRVQEDGDFESGV